MPILQRLRWGLIGFANLRYATGPNHDLPFKCSVGAIARGEKWADFDCDWVGNTLRPGHYRPRGVQCCLAAGGLYSLHWAFQHLSGASSRHQVLAQPHWSMQGPQSRARQ